MIGSQRDCFARHALNGAKWITDPRRDRGVTHGLTLTAGASNILDVRPDKNGREIPRPVLRSTVMVRRPFRHREVFYYGKGVFRFLGSRALLWCAGVGCLRIVRNGRQDGIGARLSGWPFTSQGGSGGRFQECALAYHWANFRVRPPYLKRSMPGRCDTAVAGDTP